MTSPRKNGKRKSGKSIPTLSEQTHQRILDYFDVAAKNSDHPAIRDAALEFAREIGSHERQKDARLSPNLAMSIGILILILAGVSCWFFFVYYPQVATTLSVFIVGLAIIAVCLLAMFSGHLSQTNFVDIVQSLWSKTVGSFWPSASKESPDSSKDASQANPPSPDSAPPNHRLPN